MIYQSLSLLLILLFQLLSFSALLKTATSSSSSSSSSSRSRYAAYDYDLTTPQYTPDGRLLQVEYATNACRGGEGRNPIICVGMSIPSQRDVLLYAKRQNQKRREQKEQELNESDGQRNSELELECTDNDGEDSFSEGQGLEGDALLIMATISSPPPSSSTSLIIDSKHKTDGDDKEKQSSTEQQSNYINQQRTQCRIIEVPLSTSFQTHHYGKTSSTTTTTTTESTSILIGLSGILADATSLLQIAYSVLEEEQISFGWHRLGLSPVGTTTVAVGGDDVNVNAVTKSQVHPRRQQQQQQTAAAAQPSETTVRLARAIGDRCQKHAFGGGLRPLGASLMIAGIEQQQQQQGGSGSSIKLAMCDTDPSGAISVINPFWVRPTTSTKSSAEGDVGNAEDKLVINSPRVMVSGGATQSQSKLKQTMTLRTRDLYDDIIIMNSKKEETKKRVIYSEEVFLRRALQTVIEALVEEWKGRGSIPSLSGDNSKREQSMVLPQMEVVFTTPKRGTFRLSEDDIRVLIESTDK